LAASRIARESARTCCGVISGGCPGCPAVAPWPGRAEPPPAVGGWRGLLGLLLVEFGEGGLAGRQGPLRGEDLVQYGRLPRLGPLLGLPRPLHRGALPSGLRRCVRDEARIGLIQAGVQIGQKAAYPGWTSRPRDRSSRSGGHSPRVVRRVHRPWPSPPATNHRTPGDEQAVDVLAHTLHPGQGVLHAVSRPLPRAMSRSSSRRVADFLILPAAKPPLERTSGSLQSPDPVSPCTAARPDRPGTRHHRGGLEVPLPLRSWPASANTSRTPRPRFSVQL